MFANGKTSFDQAYDVGPNGTVTLPSTLGVVSGEASSTVVRITIRGYETPCASSNDCNDGMDDPVGNTGSRILRRSVQTFVDQHTLGLRAGDALHLATASEHGASVHTLDQRLAQAGPLLGVPTQLLA